MSIIAAAAAAPYAAVFGLLHTALTVRVIRQRVRTGVQSGDGGDTTLAQAIRAHANFTEQVPIALLLIVVAEGLGTPAGFVHAMGIALLAGRAANAWGLSRSLGPTQPRQAGAGLTLLVIAAAAVAIIWRLIAAN
jgi:uncharacterized membrane protein YecN with MAPEG domain